MFTAFARACSDLFSPPLRRVVAIGLAIAIASFIVVWLLVALALDHFNFAWWPLRWLVDLLGLAGVLVVSWMLFPAVVTMVMGFFLDQVASAVEERDYPGHPRPRRLAIRETVLSSLRLMLLTVVLNLLVLPIYVLLPGINLFVFLVLNGYLFGREYFEVIALRQLDGDAAKEMRRRFSGRVFAGGVVIAGLFAVPFVNLVAPVIATAFMLHLYEGLPRLAPANLAA